MLRLVAAVIVFTGTFAEMNGLNQLEEEPMKAWGFTEYGSIDVLHEMEISRVEPKNGEIEIKLKYAAVNPVDYKIREGYLQSRMPSELPIVSGWDGSGVITRVGNDVHDFHVGDEVFGYFRGDVIHSGTYAEYITAPVRCIAKKPKELSFRDAVAFPLNGLTAWQSLFDVAKLTKGQTVVIHAAAGGVGGMAVQLAHAKGAKVIGTASKKNHDYVLSLGADIVIDYTTENVAKKILQECPQGVDFVFDCAGGNVAEESLPFIKKGGCFVSIVNSQFEPLTSRGIQAQFVFVTPNPKQLGELGQMIAEKKLKVPELTEFSFQEAKKAQSLIQTGHTRGKLVIRIEE